MMPRSFAPLVEYKYAKEDVLLVQGPDQRTVKVGPVEYKATFGSTKAHGIFYQAEKQALVTELIKVLKKHHKNNQNPDHAKVQDFLNHPKHYFTVKYLNATFGYGVVANQDIPIGTVVGIYSGEMRVMEVGAEDKATSQNKAYNMHLIKPKFLQGKEYKIDLSAGEYGDVTRFAPHCSDEIDETKLDASIKREQILTDNITFPLAIIDGKPIRYFITTEMIKKGDIASIDYSQRYWNAKGIVPSLFVKTALGIQAAEFSPASGKYVLSKEVMLPVTRVKEKREPAKVTAKASSKSSHAENSMFGEQQRKRKPEEDVDPRPSKKLRVK